ncbi:MAG: maleylpyruvate isomerase family mycothiol-dependent enzyme [Actinomycetes bacterium]
MIQQPLDTAALTRIAAGPEADALASAVYSALLDDLARLTTDDWHRPTDCTGWSVRDMVAHLVGAAQGHASLPVFVRQYAWGVRHRGDFGGSSLDAMNQCQIDGLREVSDGALLRLFGELVPKAVAGRARRTRVLGWAPVHLEQAGSWYEGMPTRTTMAELCAVVLTRDVWAHRLDIARATAAVPSLEPSVDGRIVADIVTDWAARHGRPFTLTLTGVAGGAFRAGAAGPDLTLDGLDFARLMAGRRPDGEIPDSPLWTTRVLF